MLSASPARAALDTRQGRARPSVFNLHYIGALFQLTKPRLAGFSILSAVAGYAVARSDPGWLPALTSFAGISFSAGGALSFNQWWERRTDALMKRTAGRPLPMGHVSATAALSWSAALSAAGVGTLLALARPEAAALSAATIVLYAFVYTPLKRLTRWATEIGSISGALPPLLGAAAAGDVRCPQAWVLAGVILLWQMPHFFSLGWTYRAQYQAAGFPLLPALDRDGRRTAAACLAYSLSLATFSLVSFALGWTGLVFGVAALIGNAAMLRASWRFLVRSNNREPAARRLFLTTLAYLPPVMAALVLDRLI